MPTSRRTVLVLGSLMVCGAAGGSAIATARLGSPTLRGRPPIPTANPQSHPDIVAGIELLGELRALAQHVAGPGDSRAMLRGDLGTAHAAHIRALTAPSPMARPTEDAPRASPIASPSLAPLDWPGVADAESAAAKRFDGWAAESSGGLALLWGSLSGFSAAAAAALHRGERAEPPAPGTARPPMIDEVAAMQQLVAQCHAAIFGYQKLLALASRREAQPVRAGLEAYRRLRDELSTILIKRDAGAPAAAPAYLVEATVAAVGRKIESGALPYLGQWLHAADPTLVRQATQELRDATVRAVGWGAPLPVWPGWPD